MRDAFFRRILNSSIRLKDDPNELIRATHPICRRTGMRTENEQYKFGGKFCKKKSVNTCRLFLFIEHSGIT